MSEAGRALQFAIEANQKRLDKSLARVEAVVAKTMKKIDSQGQEAFKKTEAAAAKAAGGISRSFAGIGKGIAAGLAGYLTAQGAQQLFTRIQTALDHFDDLGDAAERLGTSAKFLVQWGAALNAAGGDMEAFNTSIEEFQGKIGAVIGNIGKTKATQSALSALGISRADIAAAGDLEQKLLMIADGLAKVGDRATRAAIADKLGIRPLLPLLEQGAAGVQRLAGQFEGLGNAAQQGVDATADMADKVKTLQTELQIRTDNVFVQMGPWLIWTYNKLNDILNILNSEGFQEWFGAAFGATPLGGFSTLDPEGDSIGENLRERISLQQTYNDLVAELDRLGPPGGDADQFTSPAYRADLERRIELAKAELDVWKAADHVTAKGPPRGYRAGRPSGIAGAMPGAIGPTDEDIKNAKKAADEAQRLADIYEGLGDDIREIFRNDLADKTNEYLSKGDEYATAVLHAADDQRQAFTDAMVYAFQSGDLKGAALSFINFFTERMYRDLANSVYNALFDSAGNFGGGSGGGGLFGQLIGAVVGAFGGSSGTGLQSGFLSGFRAAGGPVSANQAYMVGERGPELFVPRTGGTIVANNRMGGTTLNVSIVNPTRDVLPAVLAKVDELGRKVDGDRANFRRNVQTVVNDGGRRNQVAV